MPTSRLNDIANFIEEFLPLTKSSRLVQNRINRLGPATNAIEQALSLGKRDDRLWTRKAETDRRRAIRTLIFLLLIDNRNPVSAANSLKQRYEQTAFNVLLNLIKQNLPLLDNAQERTDWDPMHFTPVTVAGPAPANYRYIVWGMMNTVSTSGGLSYAQLMANPQALEGFLISSSVINQVKHATYYPYGFILQVPKENVIATDPKDQQFRNYKTAAPNTVMTPQVQLGLNDSSSEIREAGGRSSIKSPATILASTNKTDGMYGYNEVVLMGTSPSGSVVRVVGMFMKVDSQGNRWVRPEASRNDDYYVSNAIELLMQATGLPIIEILDIGGKNH